MALVARNATIDPTSHRNSSVWLSDRGGLNNRKKQGPIPSAPGSI